jgi:hypothetical protein
VLFFLCCGQFSTAHLEQSLQLLCALHLGNAGRVGPASLHLLEIRAHIVELASTRELSYRQRIVSGYCTCCRWVERYSSTQHDGNEQYEQSDPPPGSCVSL